CPVKVPRSSSHPQPRGTGRGAIACKSTAGWAQVGPVLRPSAQVLRKDAVIVLNHRLVPGRHCLVAFHQSPIEYQLLDARLEGDGDGANTVGVVNGRDEQSGTLGELGLVLAPGVAGSGTHCSVQAVGGLAEGSIRARQVVDLARQLREGSLGG